MQNNDTMSREQAQETLAWHRDEYTFPTAEAYEQARGKKWVTKSTRNHAVVSDKRGRPAGIVRDVPQKGEWWDVGDEHNDALTPLLSGRKIVTVEREPDSGDDWGHGENTVTMTLDDGSRLRFTGYGYDASGLNMEYGPPDGERAGR